MKFILTLILVPVLAFGQKPSSFKKLIKETNKSLNHYEQLSSFSDQYYQISSFGLSKKETEVLISEANNESALTKNNDSIFSQGMISYFQGKIINQINQIIRHSEFQKHDIKKLITSDELSIAVSEDKKLYNFHFDEKTGGTYRSRISITHYTDFKPGDIKEETAFEKFFSGDGYSGIYALPTDEGTKYVLTGNVIGCASCFTTFVRLIAFKNNAFKEDFLYSVTNRDWNEGVHYNPETKTIDVVYHTDDLTPFCDCSGNVAYDVSIYDAYNKDDTPLNCTCKFIFNGTNFELIEEKVNNEVKNN